MQNVSLEYLSAVSHYNRRINTRVYFNGRETPVDSDLSKVTIKEIGQSKNELKLGELCTNQSTVKFVMPSEVIPLDGGYFTVEHGVWVGSDYEYVPMGTYYISDIDTVEGSGIYTVTAYDSSTRFDREYNPALTLPTTIEAVVRDICSQCNVTIDSDFVFPYIPLETIYDYDCKETIKYMASLMGKNAKINRNGDLTFYWYKLGSNETSARLDEALLDYMLLDTEDTEGNETLTYTVTRSTQYMGGFKKTTDRDIVINSLTSGTEENTLVSGVGRGITFENPYMTQEILDEILLEVDGFTYTPSEVKFQGNPAIEIGDVISVIDKKGNACNVIVGEQTIVLTGMHAVVNAKGTTESDVVINTKTPLDKKLEKFYNVMQSAFKSSTDIITGAKGGHFVIDCDENGFPTGWKIMDTPTVTDATKGWIFTKGGLGYSTNGFKTIENIAIDMLGNINANAVRTGALIGENFEINLETGTLKMGKRGEDGEFIEIWLDVSSEGIQIGKIKEIETMIDGKADTKKIEEWARFDGACLELGIEGSDFLSKLTNTELGFWQGTAKVAWISNQELNILKAIISKVIGVGNLRLVDETEELEVYSFMVV